MIGAMMTACSCLINFDKNGIPRPQYKPTETHENLRGKMATFLTLRKSELLIPLGFIREILATKTWY
jgi:hypothetical protein